MFTMEIFRKIDFISPWIDNPGLDHLVQKIFGYLDLKSLQNCKVVSKPWDQFIGGNKSVWLIQIYRLRTRPIENIKINYFLHFDDHFNKLSRENELRKEWELAIHLISKENMDSIVKFCRFLFNLSQSHQQLPPIMYDPKSACLKTSMLQIFGNLCKEFPIREEQMLSYIHEAMEIDCYTVDMVFKCLEMQGEDLKQLHLTIYRKSPLRYSQLMKKYLLLLQFMIEKANVYGFDLNAKGREGKTLFKLAMRDQFYEIVRLLKY